MLIQYEYQQDHHHDNHHEDDSDGENKPTQIHLWWQNQHGKQNEYSYWKRKATFPTYYDDDNGDDDNDDVDDGDDDENKPNELSSVMVKSTRWRKTAWIFTLTTKRNISHLFFCLSSSGTLHAQP